VGREEVTKTRHIIRFSTEEFTKLLHEGFVLDIAFGPSGAWFEWKEGDPIPNFLKRLGELRGVGTEGICGEGI
jgi:hypothetical protein